MKRLMILAVIAGLIVPGVTTAEVLSTKSRTALFRNQVNVLDTRAARQRASVIPLEPASANAPSKWDQKAFTGRYNGPYLVVARAAARRHGVPEDLFLRLVQQESGWNHRAKSHKGALGLAQLMPATARRLGVNAHDPQQNLEGGARYLKQQYLTFGTWRLALAAYNAGPGAVRKYGGVPPYKETRNYVLRIWGS